MADDLTPAPADTLAITEDLGENFSSWRRLAAGHSGRRRRPPDLGTRQPRPARRTGEPLGHGCDRFAPGAHDLRADNILLTPHAVVIMDWPYAVATTAWMDALMFLPSVAAASGGIVLERVWRGYRHTHAVPGDDVNAVLAAIAGFTSPGRCAPLRPTSLVYAPTSAPREKPH